MNPEKEVEKVIDSSKFIYEEGDMEIADNECAWCKYNNPENKDVCSKYLEGKPENIEKGDVLCREFEDADRVIL